MVAALVFHIVIATALAYVLWYRLLDALSATVTSLTKCRIAARLEGQRLVPGRQVFLREIKAVSHHHLELDLTPPRCRCRLVLDL